MYLSKFKSLALAVAVGSMLCLSGCEPPAAKEKHEHGDEHKHEDGTEHAEGDEHAGAAHNHSGWWCGEHGVPENECTRCTASLASTFKEQGDWCDEHARPESQCFKCDPERQAKFAARYKAKEGKDPPPVTDP